MRLRFRFSRRRLLQTAAALAAVLCLLALLGALLLPRISKSQMEARLGGFLHRRVQIRSLDIDPFAPALDLRGITIQDRGGATLFAAEGCQISLERSGLLRGVPLLRSIEITAPHLTLIREPSGQYNVDDILERFRRSQGPPPFAVRDLRIHHGQVDILDRESGRTLRVEEISLRLPGLSSLPADASRPATFWLSARALGSPYRLRGRWSSWQKDPSGTIGADFSGLDPKLLSPWLPLPIPRAFEGLHLGGSLTAEFVQAGTGSPPARIRGVLNLTRRDGRGSATPIAPVELRGEFRWNPATKGRDAHAELAFFDLDLPGVLPPDVLTRAHLVASGQASGTFLVDFVSPSPGRPSLAISGHVDLANLELAETGRPPFLRCPSTTVGIRSAEPLAGSYTLDRIELRRPSLLAERDLRGQVARIGKALGSARPDSGSTGNISIGEVRLREGTLAFEGSDRSSGPEAVEGLAALGNLGDIDLSVGPLLSGTERPAFDVSAASSDGATLRASGKIPAGENPWEGAFRVEGISVAKAAMFLPEGPPLGLGGGLFAASGKFRVDVASAKFAAKIMEGTAHASDLHITSPSGAELLALPEMAAEGIEVDMEARTAKVARLSAPGGRLHLQRDADGVWNLPGFPGASAEGPASPWIVTAGAVDLSEWSALIEDWSLDVPAPIAIRHLALAARDVSSQACSPGSVDIRAEFVDGGNATASGRARMTPPSLDLEVALREIPISLVQPYVSKRLKVEVQDGLASSAGHLEVSGGPGDGAARYHFAGDLLLTRVRIVDPERWEDLLTWNSLHLGSVVLSGSPASGSVGEAALSDFYARAVVLPDATFNIFHLWQPAPAGPPTVAPSDAVPAGFRLDQAVLANGTVDFADRFIYPGYVTTLHEVTGRVSGLDSTGGVAGDIEVRGRLGEAAPFEVEGMANPFRKDLFADIRASCRNVDLVPLSTYAGKYTGYTISGGKLYLEVTYHMENRHLDAKSRIFLDQFALGERVKGAGAPDLPLKLAVSLLKNRSGQIRIEIPLSGSLEDFQVDVKPLMGKMVRGMVAKVLTWPFRMIGKLFQSNPQLDLVSFEAGRATLDQEGLGILASAGSKLSARPSLKSNVAGLFEPQVDTEGLKRALLQKRVLSEKAAGLRRSGNSGDLANTRLGPGEYEEYLKVIYRSQDFPKPRDEAGHAKDLPPSEMEKLLMAYTEVGLGELRRLAQERAEAVRAALLATGAREDQVYIVDPDSLPAPVQEGMRTRAAFVLN